MAIHENEFQAIPDLPLKFVLIQELIYSVRNMNDIQCDEEYGISATLSVSSILSIHCPLLLWAKRWLNSAVLAPPRCNRPVGLGANLTRIPIG